MDNLPQPSWPLGNRKIFDGGDIDISHQHIGGEDDVHDGKLKFPVQCEQQSKVCSPKTRPLDCYIEGLTLFTSQRCLHQLVDNVGHIHRPTGCIIDESLNPVKGVYYDDRGYSVEKKLGRGSYGEVHLCQDCTSGKKFVRKTLLKAKLNPSEVIVPLHLDHKNVTKVLGLIKQEDGETLELLLDYAGEALNVFLRDKKLSPVQIWRLAKQGLEGLAHMSKYRMAHLDIKPENICIQQVCDSLVLKFTDFGSSRLSQQSLTFTGWTPEYMAPESALAFLSHKLKVALGVTDDDVTGMADIFAFQLVIQYMYRRKHVLLNFITNGHDTYNAFEECTKKEMQQELILLLAKDEEFASRMICDDCDLDMRELLLMMSKYSPKDRISAQEALEFIAARELRITKQGKSHRGQTRHVDVSSQHGTSWNVIYYRAPSNVSENNIPAPAQNMMTQLQEASTVKERLRNRILTQPYPGGKPGGVTNKSTCPPTPIEELRQLSLSCPQDTHNAGELDITAQQWGGNWNSGFNFAQQPIPRPVPVLLRQEEGVQFPAMTMDDVQQFLDREADSEEVAIETGNLPELDNLL